MDPKDDSSSPDADNRMKEWTAARAVIDKFDGYQADLRKYGFTMVTGLLSIAGLFSSSPTVAFPPSAKLGVIGSILVLIVALSFLDAQYRYLQKGATIRARVLESSLNLDLTGAIATYLKAGRFESRYTTLYLGFATGTLVVGFAILWTVPWLVLLLLLVFAAAVAAILLLRPGRLAGLTDWSVDRKVVNAGDVVRLTYTNLSGSLGELLASTQKDVRRSWVRRSKVKGSRVLLHPTGTIVGPRGTVGGETVLPAAGPIALPETDVVLEYLAQVDWVWNTPHGAPGLYDIECVLEVGIRPRSEEKPERSQDSPALWEDESGESDSRNDGKEGTERFKVESTRCHVVVQLLPRPPSAQPASPAAPTPSHSQPSGKVVISSGPNK